MPAPSSVSVTTSGAVLLEPKAQGSNRNFVLLGRQDSDTRMVYLSFGERTFTAANAAFWIAPGERFIITPSDGRWDLVNQGVFAKLSTGAAIDVQVQAG